MKKHMTLTILTASCILLCLGAFWDLKISTLFYDPHNIMGLFLQEGCPFYSKGCWHVVLPCLWIKNTLCFLYHGLSVPFYFHIKS